MFRYNLFGFFPFIYNKVRVQWRSYMGSEGTMDPPEILQNFRAYIVVLEYLRA